MNQGWIKVHRKLMFNPIFQDAFLLKLWMYCLLKASHSEHKQLVGSDVITLHEGQLVWGRCEATADLNKGAKAKDRLSESTWERHLKTLEKLEMIKRETNNKRTVVTIENWSIYQNDVPEKKNNTSEEEKKKQLGEKHMSKDNPFTFFEQNIATLSPYAVDAINNWIDDFQNEEIVCYAMEIAVQNDVRKIGYINGILSNWSKDGVKTVEDAKRLTEKMSNVVSMTKRGAKSVEPDYGEDFDWGGNVKLYK